MSNDSSDEPAGFRELGLSEDILQAIAKMGFETPTPIQEQAIPRIREGVDLIGKAETGTGKTLAFCAPMFERLDPAMKSVQALVLCPTRELAQQVDETASALSGHRDMKTALLVGGVHQSQQILALREGAQVVVGTPGRILDFLGTGTLRLGWTSYVVLDEADRMLDMGFIDDVSRILDRVSTERQMLLFSATVPPRLQSLTKRFMHRPVTISTVQGLATVPEIRQLMVPIHPGDKEGFILDLLDAHPDDTCMIFCNTRRAVIELDRTLWGMGYPAGSLHGDHDQEKRFRVLDAFKDRQISTLVATDVAGRGLDIDQVTRIINYDVPDEVESYVHRIGRTGRAGGEGESITLVTRQDDESWRRILRTTKFEVEEYEWTPSRPRTKTESFRGRDGRRGRPGGRASGGRPGGRGGARSGGGGRSRGGGRRGESGRRDRDGAERSGRRRDGEGSQRRSGGSSKKKTTRKRSRRRRRSDSRKKD